MANRVFFSAFFLRNLKFQNDSNDLVNTNEQQLARFDSFLDEMKINKTHVYL